jgi:diguanylate cyclase (GGDEF)-like protein
MDNNDLKSLVIQMNKELLHKIDSQNEATKEQVINYLQDAIATISNIDEDKTDAVEHAKLNFTDTYKEIAEKSISSYLQTSGEFEKISRLHKEAVNEFTPHSIHMPTVIDKFNDIQSYMTEEIEKANEVITMLTKQVQDLEEDSNLDGLTKVFNRRALDRYLKSLTSKGEIKYALRLLMLDVDDFKLVNDKYGHIAGDKVLIYLSNLLRRDLRDGDKVFRYGGEEFVIILNRIDPDKCQDVIQRLLLTISSSHLLYKGHSIKITASIGATQYINGDTPESILERADKALYKSKKSGKNQMNVELPDGN